MCRPQIIARHLQLHDKTHSNSSYKTYRRRKVLAIPKVAAVRACDASWHRLNKEALMSTKLGPRTWSCRPLGSDNVLRRVICSEVFAVNQLADQVEVLCLRIAHKTDQLLLQHVLVIVLQLDVWKSERRQAFAQTMHGSCKSG